MSMDNELQKHYAMLLGIGSPREVKTVDAEASGKGSGEGNWFSKFWEYQEEGWARRFFKNWFGWVSRSHLKPMAEVARLLKRHLENLLNYLRHHITNAVTEGLNSENPEHQIGSPGLPQLSKLPDSYSVFLRKAQSLPTMIREET